MAQPASSPQREPSMEEILASIRRIIEDNEPAQAEPERNDTAIRPAANDPAARPIAFDKALESGDDLDMPATDNRDDVYSVEAAEPNLEDVFNASVEADTNWQSPDWSVRPGVDTNVAFETTLAVPPPSKPLTLSPTATPPAPKPAAATPPVETPTESKQPAAMPIEPRTSILSESAGRQVAAAFGELNDAFAASKRRSFDEIAEDMMRPMLQDWLDNNLPVLVERLVREEIERVARGG